jgi:hypothetical protein
VYLRFVEIFSTSIKTDRWDAFDLQLGETSAVEFTGLQLRSSLLADAGITGDLRLAFHEGRLVSDHEQSYFRRPQVDGGPLGLNDLHADGRCVALKWTDHQVDRWLRQLAPNFSEESAPRAAGVTLRVLFGAAGERLVKEIRLDWAATPAEAAAPYTFALPGLKVAAPGATRFTLLLRITDDGPKLAFCLTLPAGQAVTASSDFA